jgi:hypothetical protein
VGMCVKISSPFLADLGEHRVAIIHSFSLAGHDNWSSCDNKFFLLLFWLILSKLGIV